MKKIVLALVAVALLGLSALAAYGRTPPIISAATPDPEYPYQAKLPPGLQDKLILEYNYEIAPSGNFVVNHRWTVVEEISHLQYLVRVLDADGKDISTRLEELELPESLRYLEPAFALYYGAGVGPLLQGHIFTGSTQGEVSDAGAVKAEMVVIYYRLPDESFWLNPEIF